MHPRLPFYLGLLLQPEMDLDWLLDLHFLGCLLGFWAMLRPRLSGKWASLSSHGFLVFLGPFMCISCLALQNTTNTKTCGID
jgi:hypothetical protein